MTSKYFDARRVDLFCWSNPLSCAFSLRKWRHSVWLATYQTLNKLASHAVTIVDSMASTVLWNLLLLLTIADCYKYKPKQVNTIHELSAATVALIFIYVYKSHSPNLIQRSAFGIRHYDREVIIAIIYIFIPRSSWTIGEKLFVLSHCFGGPTGEWYSLLCQCRPDAS
jgi:hypothetical protein